MSKQITSYENTSSQNMSKQKISYENMSSQNISKYNTSEITIQNNTPYIV